MRLIKLFISFLLVLTFFCSCKEKDSLPYKEYIGKKYQDVSKDLINDFGKPKDVYKPFFGPLEKNTIGNFSVNLFYGPGFTLNEARNLETNYRQKIKKFIGDGVDPNSFEDFEYNLKKEYLNIYKERVGNRNISVDEFAIDYQKKFPNISLDSCYSFINNELRIFTKNDLEREKPNSKFTSYDFEVHPKVHMDDYNLNWSEDFKERDLNRSKNCYIEGILSIKVDQKGIITDASNCLRIYETNWPTPYHDISDFKKPIINLYLFFIIGFCLFLFSYKLVELTNVVIFKGWIDFLLFILNFVPLIYILQEYSSPSVTSFFDTNYYSHYIFLVLCGVSFFFSFKFNNSITKAIISFLIKIPLLIILPLFVLALLWALGSGKSDRRYKDNTKGNTRTKNTLFFGSILGSVIGPFFNYKNEI